MQPQSTRVEGASIVMESFALTSPLKMDKEQGELDDAVLLPPESFIGLKGPPLEPCSP